MVFLIASIDKKGIIVYSGEFLFYGGIMHYVSLEEGSAW